MTNNEILKADTLDILFENRNKLYGAYALRRQYDQRMLQALGITGAGVLLLILFSAFTSRKAAPVDKGADGTVTVKTIIMPPPEKPKEPEQAPKPKQKPQKQVAYVPIRVDKDEIAKKPLPIVKDLENANVGKTDVDGEDKGNIFKKPEGGNGGTGTTEPVKEKQPEKQPDFIPFEKDAQFPGGKAAFRDFLARYLQMPGDLEPGEKKVVVLRFKVGADGKLTDVQVIETAGEEYTREVLRVLKKMPAWEPAVQNGIKVPVYFTQPVTFVGQEE